MSKYLPPSAVAQETYMQQLRANHGVKAGTHIKYPHAENGPYIFRKDRLEALTPEQRQLMEKFSGTKPDSTVKKLKRGFKKLFGGIK